MKLLIIPTVAIVALMGCATPATLAQKTPLIQFQTSKSAKAVASGLSVKWSGVSSLAVNTIMLEDGYMVSLLDWQNAAIATAVITEKDGVTSVRYSERIPWATQACISDAVVSFR